MQIVDANNVSEKDWMTIGELIADAIPNAVYSQLGAAFGAVFYKKLVQQKCSCGYVAKDKFGDTAGVVIGTADYSTARSSVLNNNIISLLLAANFRLFKWSIISWLIKGFVSKLKGRRDCYIDKPSAELVAIAIRSDVRGTGLAQQLTKKLEKFIVSEGNCSTYAILTEKTNTRANRFYERIGATFIRTNFHHGREINEWHKKINLTG